MQKQQPIGIFDSGVGGLTVAKLLFEHLPRERVIYLGDTAHVPYGSKSTTDLIHLSKGIMSFLTDQGVKLVIAACNTSSSISLPVLGDSFRNIPVLGVINPGARAAVEQTRTGRIGVIGTEATIRSGSHRKAIQAIDPALQIFCQACPLFVPLVESAEINSPSTREAAIEYLQPLQEKEIDTLILGCTHYPYLTEVLQEVLGPAVRLVDPAGETIKEVVDMLSLAEGLNDGPHIDLWEQRYLATGSTDSFLNVAPRLLHGFVPTIEKISTDLLLLGSADEG